VSKHNNLVPNWNKVKLLCRLSFTNESLIVSASKVFKFLAKLFLIDIAPLSTNVVNIILWNLPRVQPQFRIKINLFTSAKRTKKTAKAAFIKNEYLLLVIFNKNYLNHNSNGYQRSPLNKFGEPCLSKGELFYLGDNFGDIVHF